jgi:copper resistance protein B
MVRKLFVGALFIGFSFSNAQEMMELPPYKPNPQVIERVMLPPSRFAKALLDLFEYHVTSDEQELKYDAEFWYGGDFNRLWIETEGEHGFRENSGSVERLDLYYARLITPFWDFRIGAGSQFVYSDNYNANRPYGVVGFQGLAPLMFEVDFNVRVDTEGKVTSDLEVEYDILLTQRLIVQPRLETLFSFSDIQKVGIYQGLNNLELGLRMRYEIVREFAPYIGVNWTQYLGRLRDVMEASGQETSIVNFVAGVRAWF